MARRVALGIVAVLLAFTCTVAAQRRLDAMRTKAFYDELLYMPNEKILAHFTAGMDSVIADWLWIKCIHYTAQHFKGDGKFTWLNHLCNLITGLDPYFVPVYRYGGMFLAALKADDDASIDLLKKGMVRNPDAWELPYEIAMTYLLNRGARPDSPIHAARYLAMAVETGHAPPFVAETAAGLQAAHGLQGVARNMWAGLLENARSSGDPILRDLAQRRLTELDLRDACRVLDEAVAAYQARFGRAPETLDALVQAGVLSALPTDPLGGIFLIDAAGKVQSTTVLDAEIVRRRNVLRTAIDGYRRLKGNWPAALQEIVEAGIMAQLPAHPYAGQAWSYDPSTGEVH